MKKVLLFAFAMSVLAVSCNIPQEVQNQQNETRLIDKDKVCPPSDRNCNGVPDSQE